MNTQDWINLENDVLLHTYNRPDFVLTRGKGVYLYDLDGKEYLDCVAGIAVCAFGHADVIANDVLRVQAGQLWHCSNLYHTQPQVQLAKTLVENTFADKAFFCNSGAEASEAAIKFARKWGRAKRNDQAHEIISTHGSFHGRTYGALSATGQPKLQDAFAPLLPGFKFGDFNDLDSIARHISPQTCAIMVEPVQGEGGIYPATQEFLQGLRDLCDQHNLLLILDEVQCGFGRTGRFCAYEHYGIEPDIMTNAKPIANGLPLGAVLLTDDVAEVIQPGDHGTTFGGGPIACAVATDILKRILMPGFLETVQEKGEYFKTRLQALKIEFEHIVEVRGSGLMLAVELQSDPAAVIAACADRGLLICKTGGNAVRFLPPLIIEKDDIDLAVEKFTTALKTI